MYTIPNTFNFIYTGNGISNYFPNLAQWRNLHPEHAIHLWIAPETMKPEEVTATRHMAEKENIQLHDISKETTLRNHEYILQEISKGNPWSTSDILRISILLQQPGFYFDINVTPRKALPTDLTCEQGALFWIDNIIQIPGIKIFASAYSEHPIFDQMSQLIPINFELLHREAHLQEKINSLSKILELNQAHLFALLVTGLPMYAIINSVMSMTEIKSLGFPWGYFLDIPNLQASSLRPKEDALKHVLYEYLKNKFLMAMALASCYKNIENPSLVDRLNNVSSPSLRFFSKIGIKSLMVSAVSKLETIDQEECADQLQRELSKFDCPSDTQYIGKDKFFTIPNINNNPDFVGAGTELQDFLKKRNA